MSQVAADALALQRLYHWEKTTPERIVFTQPYEGAAKGSGQIRTWTWKRAVDETRRIAAYLKSLNLAKGSHIALISKNTAHWLMTDWAIWMAGHVSVPLYPTLAADTIRQILEHSESKLLFVGKLDGWDGMKTGVPKGLACVTHPLAPANAVPGAPTWDDIVAKTAPIADSPVRPADELCTIMYTSGTTGMPKGVMHSFGTFAWSVQSGLKRVPIDHSARMLSYLPLSHIAERTLVEHGLLATGMQVWFAESLDTFTIDLQRAKPTVFFSVPRLWVKFQQGINHKMPPAKLDRLLKLPIIGALVRKKVLKALGLDQCTFAAGGAAPMPPDLLRWYNKLGLDLVEVYGMTENCGVSHATLPGKQRPGTVGLPYEGIQSRLDPTSGEIQMKSPGVMLGYYKEPAQTKATFTDDGWLKTGDKGALDAEGNLKITGRVKDLFKTSKGKYVAPAPIEDRLVMHELVEACAVTGANLGQPLGITMLNVEGIAKAGSAEGRKEIEVSLTQHLVAINEKLDPHEQMDCLVVVTEPWSVDNGFITPTFKVKRNRIEEVYGPNYETWVGSRKKVIWLVP
ncbi:MAG: AMP-binding protein [Aquincola sp.]|nr:AMP-binding protein [Aquincola sp.]MDH4289605.1 AMP-binding protein [Aquincola sp.]